MRKRLLLPLAVSMLALNACSEEPAAPETPAAEAPAAEPAPAAATASLQDIMRNMVAPAADVVWNAVSYRSTPDGVEMVVPETDAEWETVRFQAMQLIEAAHALATPGLPVALEGQTLQDEGLEGNLTRAQIGEKIVAENAAWLASTQLMEAAANEVIAAVEARDADAISNAGGTLDGACEACHQNFWYPATP